MTADEHARANDTTTDAGVRWSRRSMIAALAAAAALPAACGWAPDAAGSPPPANGLLSVEGDVVTGLAVPWGLDFLPDGSALVTERDSARVLRIPLAGGAAVPVGVIGDVAASAPDGEGGLLGLAVSPRFATDREVFVYYSAGAENRVVAIPFDGTRLGRSRPVVTGIPSAVFHDGGRVAFGPDGMLYVGTGDAKQPPLAQDPTSLAGKILRVTPEGMPAPGNPIPGSRVYSLGHRNVQGLAFDGAGRLWASEYGEDAWDELNLIRPGANYGWPLVEGRADRPPPVAGTYVDPVLQWRPAEASPSGLTIVGDTAYMAALRGERLWAIPLAGENAAPPRSLFVERFGRLRSVIAAPDGSVWLTTSNRDGRGQPRPGDDRIIRLRPT